MGSVGSGRTVELGSHRWLGVVPARGGSKSIPRKNIRPFLGRPLLAWTVDVALESGVFDQTVLSTEDEEIAQIGRDCGIAVPFIRPKALAEDATLTGAVVRHAVDWLMDHDSWIPDFVMTLEPTSPGRRTFHVQEAAKLLVESGADSVASVSELPAHHNPLKALKLQPDGSITGINGSHVRDMIHRRQDLPRYYAFNGLVFACRTETLLLDPPSIWGDEVVAYLVDEQYNFDINTPEEWLVAEAKMQAILIREGQR